MAIHYKDHERFSKGQGFIGAMCRPVSAQATSKRWFAVDCRDCKRVLVGREIVNRVGRAASIACVFSDAVVLNTGEPVDYRELDFNWSPAEAGGEAGK